MKVRFNIQLKEYFWDSLKKITNSASNLTVTDLGDCSVKCFWELSTIDNFRIHLSKSCFYAIRLFDISNNRNKYNSTCVMKEIQVNRFQSCISFPIPINKGVYSFEFGYRKKNGEWRRLTSQVLNLGYRIKKVIHDFDDDTWFNQKKRGENIYLSFHETSYQLALNVNIGGSEKIISSKYNT